MGQRTKRLHRRLYYDYIKSEAWQAVRERYFKSNMPKDCYVCEAKAGTFRAELHHATYKRLGFERLHDLRVVCRACHQAIHDQEKRTGQSIWYATKGARRKAVRERSAGMSEAEIKAAKKAAVRRKLRARRASRKDFATTQQSPTLKPSLMVPLK